MALFKDNKEQQPMAKQVHATTPGQINMVGEGTTFEGTLRTDGDVRISGRVDGKLFVGGRIIVASEGVVDGELTAAEADISGRVDGDLEVSERLIVRGSAHIEGNIKTGRLIMEEGAVFNGECQMGAGGRVVSSTDVRQAAEQAEGARGKAEGPKGDRPPKREGGDKAKARAV